MSLKLHAPTVTFLPGLLVVSVLICNSSLFLHIKDLDLVRPITSPSCGYIPGLKQPAVCCMGLHGLLLLLAPHFPASNLADDSKGMAERPRHNSLPCVSQQDATNCTGNTNSPESKMQISKSQSTGVWAWGHQRPTAGQEGPENPTPPQTARHLDKCPCPAEKKQ